MMRKLIVNYRYVESVKSEPTRPRDLLKNILGLRAKEGSKMDWNLKANKYKQYFFKQNFSGDRDGHVKQK